MTRDMTERQFSEALDKNGFVGAGRLLGTDGGATHFRDTTGVIEGQGLIGGIFTRSGKLNRRATIAHLIKRRAACA